MGGRAMMILSKPGIIFFKPHKVAGTSLEIALSPFAGPEDVVTELSPSAEALRQKSGMGEGPRNHRYAWWEALSIPMVDWRWARRRRKWPRRFRQHMPAELVRKRIPSGKWDAFTKVSIVRCPYDAAVSRYFFSRREGQSFESFWLRNPFLLDANRRHYLINGEEVIDRYLRFEQIDSDLADLETDFPMLAGVRQNFARTRMHEGIRPPEAKALDYFARYPEIARLVETRCAWEISRFGYRLE